MTNIIEFELLDMLEKTKNNRYLQVYYGGAEQKQHPTKGRGYGYRATTRDSGRG